MLRTPQILQDQFKIPAEAGNGRAVPTVLFSYSGPNKSAYLTSVISMTVAGALAEYGGKRRAASGDISQDDLAAMCRVTRETFTRRLSLMATPDEMWDDDRRQRRSQEERQRAIAKGKTIRGEGPRRRPRPIVLIHRKRRFAAGNIYTHALPQKPREANPENFYPAELDAIRQTPELGTLWGDTRRLGKQQYKVVPRWVWDHRLPLSDTARLVFTYYLFCGLLDKTDGGHIRGVVNPKQATVADACGISIRSVYKANQELTGLGLIRVAHPKPTKSDDGRYVRGPAKILYLPIRTLTTEEAIAERLRFRCAIKGIRDASAAERATLVHQELLASWTGKEHCLRAFWNELRRQMASARIADAVIQRLVPRPPE